MTIQSFHPQTFIPRLLLVDDSRDYRSMFKALLEYEQRWVFDDCATTQELTQVRNTYDVALIDVGMFDNSEVKLRTVVNFLTAICGAKVALISAEVDPQKRLIARNLNIPIYDKLDDMMSRSLSDISDEILLGEHFNSPNKESRR